MTKPINPEHDADIAVPSSSFSWTDFEARERARLNVLAPLQAENRRVLFDALATSGIALIEVSFDGLGDSGQVESITAYDAANEVKPLAATLIFRVLMDDDASVAETLMPVEEAIERLAYELLTETHPGWENNAGAFGLFTFDVAARTIRLEHNERVEDTIYSEHAL